MSAFNKHGVKRVADEVDRAARGEDATASSLAPRRFAPIRGLFKLLVQASSSRSILGRLVASLILLSAISAFAFLGYFLPKLIASAGQ